MILQHERQLLPNFFDDSKALINSSETKKVHQKSGKPYTKFKPRICTFCNRFGHTIETCYKKHGFPPHLQRSTSSHGTVGEGITFAVLDILQDKKSTSPSLTHEQYEKLMHLIQGFSQNQQFGNVASNQVHSISLSGSALVEH